MFVIIVGITVVVAGAMSWFGLAIMSFLYSIDFEQYRGLCFVMLAAGGVTAGIEVFVPGDHRAAPPALRNQAVPDHLRVQPVRAVLLVNFTGLPGAVIGYLIVMCILLVLLVSEYASIRMDLHRKLTGRAAPDAEMPRAAPPDHGARAGCGGRRAGGCGRSAAGCRRANAGAGDGWRRGSAGGWRAPMRAAAAQRATAAQVQRAAAQRQAVARSRGPQAAPWASPSPSQEAPEPAGEEGERQRIACATSFSLRLAEQRFCKPLPSRTLSDTFGQFGDVALSAQVEHPRRQTKQKRDPSSACHAHNGRGGRTDSATSPVSCNLW